MSVTNPELKKSGEVLPWRSGSPVCTSSLTNGTRMTMRPVCYQSFPSEGGQVVTMLSFQLFEAAYCLKLSKCDVLTHVGSK